MKKAHLSCDCCYVGLRPRALALAAVVALGAMGCVAGNKPSRAAQTAKPAAAARPAAPTPPLPPVPPVPPSPPAAPAGDVMSAPPRDETVGIDGYPADPKIDALLLPYKSKVDEWRTPIVRSTTEMHVPVKSRECPLATWMADAVLAQSQTLSDRPVAASLLNGGGIRSDLPEGDVSYLSISSILPFENYVSFLDLTGAQMIELATVCATFRGRAILGGWTLEADADGVLTEARIGGQPIDPAANYRLVTIDYLANGNDGFALLKDWGATITDHLVRDAVADYARALARDGKVIEPPADPWRQLYGGKTVEELNSK